MEVQETCYHSRRKSSFREEITFGQTQCLDDLQLLHNLDFRELPKVPLENHNDQAFDTKWDEVLSAVTDRLTDNILDSLFVMQVEQSEELKYLLQVFSRSCRSSMLQCRRVGTSWWRRSGSSICTSLSWLSKCPRSHLHPDVLAGAGFLRCGSAYDRILFFFARLVEQNVDIPVPHGRHGRGGRGGLQGLRPGKNSAASFSHSLGAADEVFTWFFPSHMEKVRGWVRTRGRN